jgi:hypothetical protein
MREQEQRNLSVINPHALLMEFVVLLYAHGRSRKKHYKPYFLPVRLRPSIFESSYINRPPEK